MTFKTSWYIQDQILHASVSGVDSNNLAEYLVDVMDYTPGPIHIIVDDEHLLYSPQRLCQLTMIRRMATHPNLKSFIAIGSPYGGAFFDQILAQIYCVDFIRLPSFNTAIDHLYQCGLFRDCSSLVAVSHAVT